MDSTSLAYLIPFCLGGVFAVLGIGLFAFGLRERGKAKAAEKWPVSSGVIVSARLDQQSHVERNQGRTYTRTSYAPVIEYTYEINGRKYQGNKVFPGATMSYDLGTAQSIVNRYQPGATVSVHYDPADLTQAVLETQAKGGNLFLILGSVFSVLGIIVCCVGVVMAVFTYT